MFWTSRKQSSAAETLAIVFEYFAPNAASIFLCGSFNNWNEVATPLCKDRTGRWKVKVELPLGRHQYRYLIDGQWKNDQRPAELVDNQVGSQNCIIEI